MNMLYDLVEATGCEWKVLHEALVNDPRIGESHTQPAHGKGRGAGGHCLIKDFEALRRIHAAVTSDEEGKAFLRAMAEKNVSLLKNSNKDMDLLSGVYGDNLSVEVL
jgi:UDP-glucose 6-dehydrogenase